MTTNVLSLDEHRDARSAPAAGCLTCSCGSAWFDLVLDVGAQLGVRPGALTFDAEGRVAGFAGTAVCTECGEPSAFHEQPPSR